MNYIFNKEKLTQVLSDFYNSTGIAVALYDASMQNIAGAPSSHSSYCTYIRNCGECKQNCSQSNLIHLKEVSLNRKICRYTCHAGLMETILPIVYEDVLIAYIQIGQFRDEEGRYSSEDRLKEVAELYGFSLQKLLALYETLPVVSSEKLSSLYRVVDIIVKSFWLDGLITCKRSMLSIKIERYIDEHLEEKIGLNDICNEFFISKNTAYQLFHDEFNNTVNGFITQKRLNRAQELLQIRPELNITQVSLLCGFPDYNYFIRLFKKQIGITPLQWRKIKKKSDELI
jgi:AraC-like DNA-binding protein